MALIRGDESARGIGDALLDTPALLPLQPHFHRDPPHGHYWLRHVTWRKENSVIYSKTDTVPSAWHLLQDKIKRKLLGINKQGDLL